MWLCLAWGAKSAMLIFDKTCEWIAQSRIPDLKLESLTLFLLASYFLSFFFSFLIHFFGPYPFSHFVSCFSPVLSLQSTTGYETICFYWSNLSIQLWPCKGWFYFCVCHSPSVTASLAQLVSYLPVQVIWE